MKKMVIAAAIIAAGAGAYWYTQHGTSSSASANPLLDYVPVSYTHLTLPTKRIV